MSHHDNDKEEGLILPSERDYIDNDEDSPEPLMPSHSKKHDRTYPDKIPHHGRGSFHPSHRHQYSTSHHKSHKNSHRKKYDDYSSDSDNGYEKEKRSSRKYRQFSPRNRSKSPRKRSRSPNKRRRDFSPKRREDPFGRREDSRSPKRRREDTQPTMTRHPSWLIEHLKQQGKKLLADKKVQKSLVTDSITDKEINIQNLITRENIVVENNIVNNVDAIEDKHVEADQKDIQNIENKLDSDSIINETADTNIIKNDENEVKPSPVLNLLDASEKKRKKDIKEKPATQTIIEPEKIVSPIITPSYKSALLGCRSVDQYIKLNAIDEGTYGIVYRAKDKDTGEIVALKRIKMDKITKSYFPITSLREITILQQIKHPNIVHVKEIVIGKKLNSIYMVMEYLDHDVKALLQAMKEPFSIAEVKCLMIQLLLALETMHKNWIIHRDIKSSNLLINNEGILKVCDFGLARKYGSPIENYTDLVVTLWYRAPEILLGSTNYTTAIDMWSAGCCLAELLIKEPLLTGKDEFDQLTKMFNLIGTPNEQVWPGLHLLKGAQNIKPHKFKSKLHQKFPKATAYSLNIKTIGIRNITELGFDLLTSLLNYDPFSRITAQDALKHPWFSESPLPLEPKLMPTFPSLNELNRIGKNKTFRRHSPSEVLAPRQHEDDGDEDGIFQGTFII